MRDFREILLDEWILRGRRLHVKRFFKVHRVTDAEYRESMKELRELVQENWIHDFELW